MFLPIPHLLNQSILRAMEESDLLMKTIPYDESLSSYHRGTLVGNHVRLSNRFDYKGYDFSLYQNENWFYAVRLIPTLQVFTKVPDDFTKKYVEVFVLNGPNQGPWMESSQDIRDCIDQGKARIGYC